MSDLQLIIILLTAYLLTNILILNYIGKKRSNELQQIAGVINKIRNNLIKSADEIILNGTLHDIENEIKMMFEKTTSNIEYLKKLERVRTEFIANTSHELRTPVFAIQGYIETLLNGALEDPKVNKSFLEKANQYTLNLNDLLNDLIDISMIESGEMRMHFRYFQINDLISIVVEEFRSEAAEKNIQLNFVPAGKKLSLFGDKEKIRQALINLIQNAIKYTEQGGIVILIEEEPKYGKIIVRDTGIGIPPEDISRIFERFYRVDKARTRSIGGTGLGLAIVKHIIEAHNSVIDVKSTLNAGSEFSFRLKK